MKKLVLVAIAVLSFASVAFAGRQELVLYNSSTAGSSAAFRTTGNLKSVAFTGIANDGTTTISCPGTVSLYVAPTSSGPWIIAKDRGNTAATNSAAANSMHNIEDAWTWVKVTWTKSATGRLKVFLNTWSE